MPSTGLSRAGTGTPAHLSRRNELRAVVALFDNGAVFVDAENPEGVIPGFPVVQVDEPDHPPADKAEAPFDPTHRATEAIRFDPVVALDPSSVAGSHEVNSPERHSHVSRSQTCPEEAMLSERIARDVPFAGMVCGLGRSEDPFVATLAGDLGFGQDRRASKQFDSVVSAVSSFGHFPIDDGRDFYAFGAANINGGDTGRPLAWDRDGAAGTSCARRGHPHQTEAAQHNRADHDSPDHGCHMASWVVLYAGA